MRPLPPFEAFLEEHHVAVNADEPSQGPGLLTTLLLSFGPTILLVLGFIYVLRRSAAASGGGMFGLGRTQARVYDAERSELELPSSWRSRFSFSP